MTFEYGALGRGIIIPDPHSAVSGARCNDGGCRIGRHVVDWAFMANELIGS